MAKDSLPATIAIDGPAASGKTMLGQALAQRLGYVFLDTGRMYRAFTLAAILGQVRPADLPACVRLAASGRLRVVPGVDSHVLLDGVDVTGLLREPAVEANVSATAPSPSCARPWWLSSARWPPKARLSSLAATSGPWSSPPQQ